MEYKKPTVKLTGTDGNAFALMAKVQSALRKAGASQTVIGEFKQKAMSGDYDNLLRVCMEYANVK